MLSPEEMLSSHVLPVTSAQARKARAPKLRMDGVCFTSKVRMAGNGMNLPCIGALMLGIITGLEEV